MAELASNDNPKGLLESSVPASPPYVLPVEVFTDTIEELFGTPDLTEAEILEFDDFIGSDADGGCEIELSGGRALEVSIDNGGPEVHIGFFIGGGGIGYWDSELRDLGRGSRALGVIRVLEAIDNDSENDWLDTGRRPLEAFIPGGHHPYANFSPYN